MPIPKKIDFLLSTFEGTYPHNFRGYDSNGATIFSTSF
jgi:hypothetical protein